MGAWAEDTFGNDYACDWIYDFLDEPGLETVRAVLSEAIANDDYMESDEGAAVLGACEVIARLQGHWGVKNSYSESLDKWIEANPQTVPGDFKALASQAIDRVLGEDSELVELWEEDGPNEAWRAAVEDLRTRAAKN